MTPLGWLIGFLLPACGASGAAGVPPPPDLAHLVRPARPNNALAAPAGFSPKPDIITPVYFASAERLKSALREVAAGQPRTFLLSDAGDQIAWVARSAIFNFPDIIAARAAAEGTRGSTLVLYSQSVYGRSDFGVNRRRLVVWLAALSAALQNSTER